MNTKHSYITPEVTTEFFLVKEYLMFTDGLSNAKEPGVNAPERCAPAF